MANDYLTLLQGTQPAAPGGNPYMDMLEQDAGRRDAAFRGSAYGALGANPDQEARARRVASYLGTTPPAVQALPEEAERAAKIKQIDDATAQAPVLRRQYTSADFARLAHDDAAPLAAVETAISSAARYVFSAGSGPTLMGDIAAGFLQSSRGAAGLFRAGAELAAPLLDPLAGTVLPENPLRRVAAGFDESAQIAQQQARGFSPPTDSIVQSGVSSGVQSALQTALALPAAAVAGPSAVVQIMAAFEGGRSSQQAREAGMSPVGAATFGASQAVIEYATEKLPIHALVGDLRTGASLLKTLGHQIVTEVPGEQVATVLQDLNEWAALNPEKPFSDYLAERPSAALQTLIATAVGVGAQTGVGRVATRVHDNATGLDRQARAAEAQAAAVEQLLAAAASSKLRERAPDSFEQFVRTATEEGPLENVYIDAAALQQSGVVEQLAELSPAVAEQLPAALAAGGTVQIPVAELVGRLDQAGIAPKLLDDLRTDPNGMSRAEAAAFMQSQAENLRADVERTLDEQAQANAFQASRDEVQAAITEQLKATQRFTEDVNNAYGALASAWYATQAARLGTTPSELFKAMPLTVQAETMGADGLDQGARGQYAPSTRTITLMGQADLSTFLHEMGHFSLDTLGELASRDGAPAAFGQDMQTLLDWFGVKDLATWRGMTLDQQRESHEKFARGFEAYLFEGKAPSIELQGLFQRFRAWLLNVYRSLRALNVELTDDVRGVMDRMLATTDAIKEMEALRGFAPAFTPQEAAKLGVDYAAYHEAGVQATQDAITALDARGLRDMQWLANARGRELRKLQKLAAAKRKEVRAEVEAEVRQQPIYAVQRFLSHGELAEGGRTNAERRVIDSFAGRSTKLDLPALKAFYGDGPAAPWRYLSTGKNGLATAQDGLSPDLVAELFGYTSGDHLVRAILAAEKESTLVDALTDQRMLERYGELSSQQDLERAADAAVHNDARALFIAAELNALAKAVNVRAEAGADVKGRRRTVAVLPQLGRQFAVEVVGRTKVRDLRPSRYTAAEAKAGRAAEAAVKKGDIETAATEKRNQLLNNYAARAAMDAQSEVEQIVRYLRKFDGDSRSLDADYAEQIDALLERVNLRARSLKAIDRAKTLAEWVDAQREQGMEPDIPPQLLNEAYRTSYRDMTVEELRGLRDTVKQIEHLGRLKHKLLTAKEQREWDAIRDEIATSINDNAGGRKADTRTPATVLGKSLLKVREFGAAHIKAATWARIFDGGKDGGPVWEYLVRSANERGDQETTMRAQATEQLHEILAPLTPRGGLAGKATYFPSIGKSLTREQVIAMALNTGNASNLQRLLGGEGWTLDQLQPVLATLTAQEWQGVQRVWDHFEQYRSLIGAKERRVYGKEPEWVEPGSAVTQMAGGLLPAAEGLKGGYYPIRYDPLASSRAEQHNEAEAAKRALQGAYTSATTRRGFTKSRVDEVNGRPLLYSLSGVYSGVNDVIHDLSWHEWLIDANKILRSEKIDRAIRAHYGPEVMAQLKSWVKDIAAGDRPAADAIDAFVGRIRQGVSAAGLSFNVMSAVMQPLGLTQSIVRVGAGWVGRGIAKYIAGPIDATREANEKSAFMRERARTRFRELNELRNMVEGQSQAKELLGRYGYWLMMRCQQMVDVPTWHGAYEKAIAAGNNEERAVALADQAVIDAQGGGQTKDLSRIERGGATARLFTVFYSFMNTAANLGVSEAMTADTPRKKAKLAVTALLLTTVPAVLGALLKDALTPGDSGDDDPAKLMRKLLGEQLGFMMGLMVGVREFSDAGRSVLGLSERPRDYSGPAGLRPITDTYALAKQVNQGEFDDAFRKAFVNVMGDLFGLPAAQINRTITGAKALKEGETENPAALVFGFQRAN